MRHTRGFARRLVIRPSVVIRDGEIAEQSDAAHKAKGTRGSLLWGCTLALLLACLAGAPAAAEAAPKTVSGYFPPSLNIGTAGGQFDTPRGVAVSSSGAGAADSGDLYVVDGANHRVQVFSSAGVFKFAFGRDVVKPGGPGNVANNERQVVTVAGATGGTFTLEFRGGPGGTPAIPFDASAAVMDAALEASSEVGVGNVEVAGPAGGPWTVEFVGALADQDVEQLDGRAGPATNPTTSVSYGLTPPGSTVTVQTTVPGANSVEVCSSAGECKAGVSGAAGGVLSLPQGIAVDQSDGSVYVSERGNLRVQKFSADGTFLRAWGKDVSAGNPSVADEVCTVASDCKAGVTGGTALARGGEFSSTFTGYLAVVPSGAPNAGNVVVADPGNRRVQEFDSSGGFVRAFGWDVVQAGGVGDDVVAPVNEFEVCTVKAECKTGAAAGAGVGQFAAGQPTRVAVDSAGAVYTSEPGANFRVQKFDQALTAPAVFAAGLLSGNSTTDGPSDIAIGAGDNVLVGKQFAAGVGSPAALVPERRVLELDSTGALQDVHGVGGGLGSATVSSAGSVDGLATNLDSGVVYVAASRFLVPGQLTIGQGNRVYMLESVLPPTGLLGASAVDAHSALLSGAVNPNGPSNPLGVIDTSYRLEVSEDGVAWSTLVNDINVGHGTSSVGFSKVASGLKADTLYQTRLTLVRPFNLPVVVAGPSFVTAASRPDVEALSPADRSSSSVTLKARVNPNGVATSYRFEYGPTVAYGTSVPVPDGDAGSAAVSSVVSQPISGLQPDSEYHFRVVAVNANGTAVSADRVFTTRTEGQSPGGRSYEMVSQPDKIGGVGVGTWAGGPGNLAGSGIASYSGERFLVGGSYGAPLNGDSAHGYTNDWSAAERAGDVVGWRSHSPITHPNYQPVVAQFVAVTGVSEDLSRLFMTGGNVTPSIFPEMGTDSGWNLFNAGFFVEWGAPPEQPSRWELLGPANLDQVSDNAPTEDIWNLAFSADGSALLGQTGLDNSTPRRSTIGGLAGDGDPTGFAFDDLVAGRSIYLADTSGAPADTFEGTGERELVNVCTGSAGARTELPSVTADGLLDAQACPAPEPGRDSRLISDRGAALSAAGTAPALTGTISEDGSRVFFMSPDPRAAGVADQCGGSGDQTACPPQLYVRDQRPDGTVRTRWISKAEPALFGAQAASLTGQVRFEGATRDGSRVFFRTNSPLATDDPNGLLNPPADGVKAGRPSDTSWDLYMYEFPTDPNADLDDGQLTRISAGPQGSSDCNSPLVDEAAPGEPPSQAVAALRFKSDDGRRVYFVCSAPLPGVAGSTGSAITQAGGTRTTSDQTNLYLYDESKPPAHRWAFITRLPRAAGKGAAFDGCASTGALLQSALASDPGVLGLGIRVSDNGGPGVNCFDGTSDGSLVTFFTFGGLVEGDPDTPATGDIYAYDASAEELIRVTAPQGGDGGTYPCAPGQEISPPPDAVQCHGDNGVDDQAGLLGFSRGGVMNPGLGLIANPEVAGDRVVFFQSMARLIAEDFDDGYDVYRWRNGELSLVTSGAADSKDALYKGNDRDGRNVFLVTRDRLSWQDYDDVADIYTARVGGGVDEPDPPVICDVLGGVCQDDPGAGLVGAAPVTAPARPDDNAASGRQALSLAAVGAKARRRAARTGVIALRVRTSGAGTVRVLGRARFGGRSVKVADTRKRVAQAGAIKVRVRLSARARRALRAGRRLSVSLQVTKSGARSRTATVQLERGKRS